MALDLISKQGIQELTMKKIASAIGVTEPALYRHFASKSDILSAVVDRMALSRSGIIAHAFANGGKASQHIASFFRGQAELFEKDPAMTVILLSEDLFRNDEILSGRMLDIMRDTELMIRRELERGSLVGEFSKALDVPHATLMLLGGFRLVVASWRNERFSFPLVQNSSEFIESVLILLKR